MNIREFVRNHLSIKNFVSNIELLAKTVMRKPISYEADRMHLSTTICCNNCHYAIVHVWAGHIPYPLIWGLIRKFGRFTYQGGRYDCERTDLPELELVA